MLPFLIPRTHLPVFFWACMFMIGFMGRAHAQCTFPTALQGDWYKVDTSRNINIDSTSTTGQEIYKSSGGTDLYEDGFDCFSNNEDKYVFKTKVTLPNSSGGQTYGYICWELIEETTSTYLLYDLTAVATEGAFNTQKVKGVDDTAPDPTLEEVCTLSSDTQVPTLLYKSNGDYTSGGSLTPITSVEQQCSSQLLATYSYAKDGADCSGSRLDFCKGRLTARVNYTACPDKILFSEEGLLSCLASSTSDSITYQLLYNHDDSVDDSTNYKFVCMQLTKSGGTEEVTVYPNFCGNTGATTHQLSLTRTASCPVDDDGTDLVPIIVGVVVSVVVIIIILAVIALVYTQVYKKGRWKWARAVTPIKPIHNGTTVHVYPEGDMGNTNEQPLPQGGENSPNEPEENRRISRSRLPPLETSTTPRSEPLRQ